MFGRFVKPKEEGTPPERPLPRLKPGTRIYAVGDIHGRADLLAKILQGIDHEEARRPAAARTLEIFLGDMIDRGPDTRGVIDLLLKSPGGNRERILLRGNHEASMLKFFLEPQTFPQWAHMGGLDTLASYAIEARLLSDIPDMIRFRDTVFEKLPRLHLQLLAGTKLYHIEDDYLFVHAGVRPTVPLTAQPLEDLLWIREPFLSWDKPLDLHVVHGHTPRKMVEILPHRTNIDTGAYFSDRLTCLVVEDDQRHSFATLRRGAR